jgi:hypothetical protein
MLKGIMEPGKDKISSITEDEVENTFKETVPQLGIIRLLISIVLYLSVFALLRDSDSSVQTWVLIIFAVGVLNIIIWVSIKKYRLAKFKKSFNITRP